MASFCCPRCASPCTFQEDQPRVCPSCNYPGTEVRLENRIHAVDQGDGTALQAAEAEEDALAMATDAENPWAVEAPQEEAQAAAPEDPEPPSTTVPGEAEAPGTAPPGEAEAPRVAPPVGASWDEAARHRKEKVVEPVPRHPDLDLRIVGRMRRIFRIPEEEQILDCIDKDLVARDRLLGREGLVLTERRVHWVKGRPGSRRRVSIDLSAVRSAGHARAFHWGLFLGAVPVALVAGAVAAAAVTRFTSSGFVSPLGALAGAGLAAGGILLMALLGRRHALWVEGGEARPRMLLRNAKEERLQDFVDGVLAQKDRRA